MSEDLMSRVSKPSARSISSKHPDDLDVVPDSPAAHVGPEVSSKRVQILVHCRWLNVWLELGSDENCHSFFFFF